MMPRSLTRIESPWDDVASLLISFWRFDAKGGEEGLFKIFHGLCKGGTQAFAFCHSLRACDLFIISCVMLEQFVAYLV
jgi:hypothetical protein